LSQRSDYLIVSNIITFTTFGGGSVLNTVSPSICKQDIPKLPVDFFKIWGLSKDGL